MDGPVDTPYHGYIYDLEMFLPIEYPMQPPKFRFLTKIYQFRNKSPNIDRIGRICLDILKDRWTPILQIRVVCMSIQILLQTPNPNDPLVADIARHWATDEESAKRTAREWARLYARPRI